MLFILASCLEEEGVERNYPVPHTEEVTEISNQGARFAANIASLNLAEVTDHGFVWGKDPNLSVENSFFVKLGPTAKSEFSAVITSTLEPQVKYYCRSYIKAKDKTIYGNIINFVSLGSQAPVITDFFPKEGGAGDTILVRGRNFSFKWDINMVKIDNSSLSSINPTDTSLLFIVPNNLTTLKNKIRVSVLGNETESQDFFTLLLPEILSVANAQFTVCDTIRLQGIRLDKFGLLPTIKLNGEPASLVSVSGDEIKILHQRILKNPVNVKMSNGIFEPQITIEMNQIQPEVLSVQPENFIPGEVITVKGKNFPLCFPITANILNAVISIPAKILSNTAEEITLQLPSDIACTGFSLNLQLSLNSSVLSVTPLQQPGTQIFSIEPDHGIINDEIVIRGENLFTGGDLYSMVNFLNLYSISDTEYRGYVKSLQVNGPVDVEIQGCNGTTVVENAFQYDPPQILDFYPKNITGFYDVIDIEVKNFAADFPVEVRINDRIVHAMVVENRITLYASEIFANDPNIGMNFTGKINITTTATGQSVSSTDDLTINYETLWKQVKGFPSDGRTGSVSFSINGKGYAGGGINDSNLIFKDFWEYDPVLDNWTRKADLPGGGADGDHIALSASGKAFVGLGKNYGKAWWEYDPSNNSWTRKADYPGEITINLLSFEIGGNIYVGAGTSSSGAAMVDFYQYQPGSDQWIKKADFPGLQQPSFAFGFKNNGYAYGFNFDAIPKELVYDPVGNTWSENDFPYANSGNWSLFVFDDCVIATALLFQTQAFIKIIPGQNSFYELPYAGPRRQSGAEFVINNIGYLGLGYDFPGYHQDFMAFDPSKM